MLDDLLLHRLAQGKAGERLPPRHEVRTRSRAQAVQAMGRRIGEAESARRRKIRCFFSTGANKSANWLTFSAEPRNR